jgi:predicted acylesterase/phospholipase RssA
MQYDMVFEGGGAKGIAFVGAMQELEARGHTPARLMGASAGAIMATFVAAGYNSGEMAEALNETENSQPVFLGFLEYPTRPTPEELENSDLRQLLREVNSKLIPDLIEDKIDDTIVHLLASSSRTQRVFSFIDKGGFYAAQKVLNWLRDKLNSGIYELDRGDFGKGKPRQFGDMTLAEYYQATGVALSLATSDTTDANLLILNHRTAPNCPLIWSVRMSMSFPLLWQEVVWQPEWGEYRGKNINGHTLVDGGMLSNFPIELFISNLAYVTSVMGEKTGDDSNVIGFLIDEGIEVPGSVGQAAPSDRFDFSQLQTIRRVMKLINTMTQAHDKKVIEAYEDRVVRLPAKGYGTIEFGMSESRRNALVTAGRAATAAYFDGLETRPPTPRGFPRGDEEAGKAPSPADKISKHLLDK